MKKLFWVVVISVCFLSSARAENKNATTPKILTGTISSFECGDNCYLTIIDKKGREHTALCSDSLCEKLMTASGNNFGGYKGKKVKVTVGTGQQVDGSGTVMDTMDAFIKIRLIK